MVELVIDDRERVVGQTKDTLEAVEEVVNDGGLARLRSLRWAEALRRDGALKSLAVTVDQVTSNKGVIEGSMVGYIVKIRIASRQIHRPSRAALGVLDEKVPRPN